MVVLLGIKLRTLTIEPSLQLRVWLFIGVCVLRMHFRKVLGWRSEGKNTPLSFLHNLSAVCHPPDCMVTGTVEFTSQNHKQETANMPQVS